MSYDDDALAYHQHDRPGKISVVPTKSLETQHDLALAYSPGVAAPCRVIHQHPDEVYRYTAKGNLVAVVSNGSAVLGLGDIGPLAAKPVMEGKANLFKKFADIDVFDIELDAKTSDEIVQAVRALAPTFGGINLEDIKAPECFEVERKLQEILDIPVFHDDQHGTAIISAAALINACHLTNREMSSLRIVFSGAGAAAMACARLYMALGVLKDNILICDSKGVIYRGRVPMKDYHQEFAPETPHRTLADAIQGADVFIGLSIGGLLTVDMVKSMAPKPIIFAMANPDPEIPYDVAKATRPDAIIATGRSDFPNQVNNVLGFPFVFRGALDCHARKITEEMKIAATLAIAKLARSDVPDTVLRAYGLQELNFGPEYLIPKPFDPRMLLWVAPAVAEAAATSGVARAPIHDLDAYREQLHQIVERARGLLHPLISRARCEKRQRIVFPEGDNGQVIRAARILADQKICTPILLGDQGAIESMAESLGLTLDGIEIDEAAAGPLCDVLADQLWHLRRRRGLTLAAAQAMLTDRAYYGTMLVKAGHADGLVGGIGRAYKHTLRPALRILGTAPHSKVISGVYAMLFEDRKIFLGDCTVNLYPNAESLAEVALHTAQVAETFGQTPRVAMLSYSDFGEHRRDPKVQQVRDAIALVRERRPDLQIDGEMQADTAVDWSKMQERFPFTHLDSPANVLVFPDLPSGNISYKLLSRLGGAETLGPLLVGLAAPVNIIPVHASVSQIVNVATYTVNQALDAQRG